MLRAQSNLSTHLIVGDESGIVVIRQQEIEDILARAEERCRKEAALMNKLRASRTDTELLGLDQKSVGNLRTPRILEIVANAVSQVAKKIPEEGLPNRLQLPWVPRDGRPGFALTTGLLGPASLKPQTDDAPLDRARKPLLIGERLKTGPGDSLQRC
jgi:hypothetical protein